jgi:hypothetical protein
MPCALAAVLLPESRAHGCHMQKTLFPGPAPHVRGGIRARPVTACGVRSCGVGGRWESERRPGCREAVPNTAGRRRPSRHDPHTRQLDGGKTDVPSTATLDQRCHRTSSSAQSSSWPTMSGYDETEPEPSLRTVGRSVRHASTP